MANFSIKGVAFTGLSVAVPADVRKNSDNQFFPQEEVSKFSESTGVYEFRVANEKLTTSDMGFEAADRLLSQMNVDRSEIDVLVFVSQTPDYANVPNTAPILQDRLGVSKGCIAFDLPLGCSGFVYGMSAVTSFLQNPAMRKGLLVFGDTATKTVNDRDKSTSLLFGDAAGAALFERTENAKEIAYNLGSDGAGYQAIIIKDGGFRNPYSKTSLDDVEIADGIVRNNCNVGLDGMDVFSFGITQAPKSVKELYAFTGIGSEDVDYAVFHQANMMMNEMIRKKLKLDVEKVPYSLEKYGNTSSASIPITMVTELKDALQSGEQKLLLCGFGVGLSWGTALITTDKLTVLDLIEI